VATSKLLTTAIPIILGLLVFAPADSLASHAQKHKGHAPVTRAKALSRTEIKDAQARLVELGYGKGGNALIAFQKYEGRKANGRLTRDDLEALQNASAP
jgi:hypothetical protein